MSRLSEALNPTAFGGQTYLPKRDGARLSHQLSAVKTLMLDGQWRSLSQISVHTGSPQTSVSARLRDLRKREFGGLAVERRHVSSGLYEYRVLR